MANWKQPEVLAPAGGFERLSQRFSMVRMQFI